MSAKEDIRKGLKFLTLMAGLGPVPSLTAQQRPKLEAYIDRQGTLIITDPDSHGTVILRNGPDDKVIFASGPRGNEDCGRLPEDAQQRRLLQTYQDAQYVRNLLQYGSDKATLDTNIHAVATDLHTLRGYLVRNIDVYGVNCNVISFSRNY